MAELFTAIDDDDDAAAPTQFASLGKFDASLAGPGMSYLMPVVLQLIGPIAPGTRVLDVGCGVGGLAAELSRRGCDATGIDLDEENLANAAKTHRDVRFVKASADAEILETLNMPPFDLVTCTEVIEHLYSPHALLAGCFAACKPGGRVVVSAPYHGYLKNLVIALSGNAPGHYNPLWEGGHIKFFSRASMTAILEASGFGNIRFAGAGRFPYMWKSLVMSADRPT